MLTKSLLFLPNECSTRDVAQALGLAVRSVQLMVDRGDLEAWRTPGGHRRISRASVERWVAERRKEGPAEKAPADADAPAVVARDAAPEVPAMGGDVPGADRRAQVLLIEDSAHFQNLVRLLVVHNFPEVDLHVAEDGIVGLAMAGELRPDVLLVDVLLPGIDGATLIARLHSHPQFQRSRLIVLTSLDEAQRSAYAFALTGLPVVHKPRMAEDLPVLLKDALYA
ncbi:response regulator [Alicycliphilus sp. T452]|jgi:excisionase family DNA binding protein